MKALLFDIDGTLVNSHGLGRRAFEDAILNVTGIPVDMSTVDWYGRTDYDIVAKLLEEKNISSGMEEKINSIFKNFVIHFRDYAEKYSNAISVFPGVKDLLEALSSRCIGLVTGNVMEAAYIKLEKAGIKNFFPYGIGGFGNEKRERHLLVPIALERMKKYYECKDFSDVFIIGDSPRDIECAKKNNAKSLIVATGRMNKDELAQYKPDYIFSSFEEKEKIMNILN